MTQTTNLRDQMVRLIGQDAANKAAGLAGQLVRAMPDEKEPILAALDFERWLAETCQECRE